tara:strand:+ start:317 stop:1000 length:684 start_codon:yes stop_codon:yes gene_type:complete
MSLYSRAENEAQSIKVLNTTEKASVKKYESDGTLVAHDGNTNATSGAEGNAAIAARAIFIDAAEAVLAENQERGLNAPGWWQYTSYTDASGETRHKAVHLAAFKSAPANTADSDDAIAADVASAITISAQPANVTGAADPYTAASAFAVTAAATTGSLLYQWQKQTASGTRWTNVTDAGVFSGATTATLAITAGAKSDLDGYKFRVKITSTAGAEEVVSDSASLAFA